MTKESKKEVNACIDFINTTVKGHFHTCACDIFGVTSLDKPLAINPGIEKAPNAEKLAFINRIAKVVVERCSLTEVSLTNEEIVDKGDGMYHYARVLRYYSSLVMEFHDAWHEGDRERVVNCWKLLLPHFKVAGSTKYSLEALKLQIQTSFAYSPNLAHLVMCNWFVN